MVVRKKKEEEEEERKLKITKGIRIYWSVKGGIKRKNPSVFANVENEKIEFHDIACKDAAKCEIFPRLLHLVDVCAAVLLTRISEQGKREIDNIKNYAWAEIHCCIAVALRYAGRA